MANVAKLSGYVCNIHSQITVWLHCRFNKYLSVFIVYTVCSCNTIIQYILRKLVVNHIYYHEKKWTTWIEINQKYYNLQTWPFEPAEESMCFRRGPLEWVMEVKNINHRYIFDCSHRLLQIAAIGAKKLLVENKITACVKELIISWVYRVACKVSSRK